MKKVKKFIVIVILAFFVYNIEAATVIIQNNTNYIWEVQPMQSREDEYRRTALGSFEYSLKPGESVSYSSWLKEIMGFRWRRYAFNATYDRMIVFDYITPEMPSITRFSNSGLFQICSEGKMYRYYFDKNNPNHYYEKNAVLTQYEMMRNPNQKWDINRDISTSSGDWVYVK